jgi:hypothetical protein
VFSGKVVLRFIQPEEMLQSLICINRMTGASVIKLAMGWEPIFDSETTARR